jgi:hypothetical protein
MIQSYSSHASEFKSEDKVSFDDEAGMRNLGEKSCDENVSRLPSNYFRNGRRSVDEDDVSEVEKRLLLKVKLPRSKQNSSFLASKR